MSENVSGAICRQRSQSMQVVSTKKSPSTFRGCAISTNAICFSIGASVGAAKTPLTAASLGGTSLPCWMFADGVENPPQVHDANPIELKCDDGCAAGRSQPYYDCEVVTPREMRLPFLLARVKQRRGQFADWIARGCLDALMLIAPTTRKGQIGFD